jgi:hypothetical protein
MFDPLSSAERYRSDADKFSELAKNATNLFMRQYYERLARQYLIHAETEEKIAKISGGSAAGQDDSISDSPSVQAAPEAGSPEELSVSVQPASPAPLQPGQGPAGAPRQSRRRRKGRV